jgi:hypothetical protein
MMLLTTSPKIRITPPHEQNDMMFNTLSFDELSFIHRPLDEITAIPLMTRWQWMSQGFDDQTMIV